MDVTKTIEELRQEQANIGQAIIALERIALGRGKRRGRPPKWMQEAQTAIAVPKRRGRPPGSRNKAKQEIEG